MYYDVCILSSEEAFARMLCYELEDRGLRVAILSDPASAVDLEAQTYLIDDDCFAFTPRKGRVVRYGRCLADQPPPVEQLHRPFSLSALTALLQGGAARGLFLLEKEQAALLNGERIALTEREYACLRCLVHAEGAPVSKQTLLAEVWGTEEQDIGVVAVYLHYLRKKLERRGKKMIYAIRGHGYALRQEDHV